MPRARETARRGLNHLGHEGLVRRVIGGHWGLVPKLQVSPSPTRIEAYNFPQGVISTCSGTLRPTVPATSRASGSEHSSTRVTARQDQRMHQRGPGPADRDRWRGIPLLSRIPDQCRHHPGHDRSDGNITMEKEALTLEVLAIAMAVRNSGGLVIVQVERIAERGSLNPRQVKIPGILVDCVVVAKPEHHWQTFSVQYDPAFSGEIRVRTGSILPMDMNERKIIARRAALELKANSVVNLGIGMPEGVASVANEEKIADLMTLTAEPGVIGGVPAGGSISVPRPTRKPSSTSPISSASMTAAASMQPFGPGGPAGQSEREQVRTAARGRRRLHQHQPECQEGGVRRHLHGRSPPRGGRERATAHRPRWAGEEIRPRGRASDVFRQLRGAARSNRCCT